MYTRYGFFSRSVFYAIVSYTKQWDRAPIVVRHIVCVYRRYLLRGTYGEDVRNAPRNNNNNNNDVSGHRRTGTRVRWAKNNDGPARRVRASAERRKRRFEKWPACRFTPSPYTCTSNTGPQRLKRARASVPQIVRSGLFCR